MKWVVHFAGRSDRKKVDHILFKLDRHRREVLGRADVAEHDENLVLIDELLCCQHRFLGVIAIVLDQQLELAPGNAALFVDFVDRQLHPGAGLLAIASERAGEILNAAEQDFVLGHTLDRNRTGLG